MHMIHALDAAAVSLAAVTVCWANPMAVGRPESVLAALHEHCCLLHTFAMTCVVSVKKNFQQ
jgi:hypothetical protein